MASYATKVKRDIARWREAGLIDAPTSSALSLDVERNGGGSVSFGSVLSMMAAALFAAAILIFIAANWEAIPRLVRVSMLFATIAAGYLGGAMLKLRGEDAFGQGAWMVAAAAFGASITLIGQMYHMSGDEKQAIFVWGAGTALAAAMLRSGPLNVGAVLLGAVWMLMHGFDHWWSMRELPYAYLLVAVLLYALTFWTRSVASRHVIFLSLILFGFLHYWRDESLATPLVMALLSAGLLAFGEWRPAQASRWLALGSGLPVHALLGFLTGIGIIQIALVDEHAFLVPSIAAFAGIIAALLLAGQENRMLRWLAYAAFAFQLCFVYVVMLGSMLGTAGFFVLGGLVLSVLAWLITRLERRFAARPLEGMRP
jgi:uncharacterized membrane protein